MAIASPSPLLAGSGSLLATTADTPKALAESAGGSGAPLVTPDKVLHALRRRWLIAVPLAVALAGIVYWGADRSLTPVYTARTLVHVGVAQPVLLYDVGSGSQAGNFQKNQIATVKSRQVRQAVVKDLAPLGLAALHGKGDPVNALEKEIQADFTVAPEILRITMKGSNPDELLVLVNGVRDAYLREVINKDHEERVERLRQLTEMANKQDAALKKERQKLAARVEARGYRNLPDMRAKYDNLTAQINTLQTELLLAQLSSQSEQLKEPKEPKEQPKPAAPKDEPLDPGMIEAALEQALAADPLAEGHRKEIVRLEKKVEDYKQNLLNYQTDPDYKRAVANLATAQALLASRKEALRTMVTDKLRAAQAALKANERVEPKVDPKAEPNRATSKFRIPALEAEIQKKQKEAAALAKEISEAEAIQTEITRQDEQLSVVNLKVRPLEVELQAPPRARVVEDAVIIETPKWNQSLKTVVAPAGLAFLVVIGFIAWLDLRRGQVNSSSDLDAARIRVLGAVPTVRPDVLPAFHPPEHHDSREEYLQLTDAIDMARAVIAPVVASTPGYTLVVTSATAGEGKTSVAGHLAVRFARSGLRTLLIDLDIRRPRIHALFGLHPAPGLGEWAVGTVGLAEVVQTSTVSGLDVLPAGSHDPRAAIEQIDQRFPDLLETLKAEYDVIILDTAPLLSAPETLAVSRISDGVVLSVMRDVSRLSGVVACNERLATVNARVLGAVVTGNAPPRYRSY